MFPIALFPLLALCTYNWRDISDLCIPASASSNLVGIAGDWFAYIGYQFVGLGIWSVPAICVYMGLRLILGNTCHPGRRTIGVVLLVFSATCLLQVAGTSPTIAPLLRDLNIEPNAGGAVGYLVMTRCLVYHLAPFGASVLMICLAVLSLFIIAGPRNIVSGLARLTDWAADRHRDDDLDDVDDPDAAAAAARAFIIICVPGTESLICAFFTPPPGHTSSFMRISNSAHPPVSRTCSARMSALSPVP